MVLKDGSLQLGKGAGVAVNVRRLRLMMLVACVIIRSREKRRS